MARATDAQAAHQRLSASERSLKAYAASLSTLEQAADELIEFSRRSGAPFEHLRSDADAKREVALVLENLVLFSQTMDVSSLPEKFHDDAKLGEAAHVVRAVLRCVESVCDDNDSGPAAGAPSPNTIHNAHQLLVLYLNMIDNRIVGFFDAAVAARDVTAMAYYKSIMGRLHAVDVLGGRFVSQAEIFLKPEEIIGPPGAGGVGDVCARIEEYLRAEVAVIEQVFGVEDAPHIAEMLVTRVFQETLADDLARRFARRLGARHSDDAKSDRENAIFIADTGQRVANLAEATLGKFVQRSSDAEVETIVETAMWVLTSPDALARLTRSLIISCRSLVLSFSRSLVLSFARGPTINLYEEIERSWHTRIGRSLSAAGPSSASSASSASRTILSTEVVLDLISMNEESISRAVQLPPAIVKRRGLIHSLFCDVTPDTAGDSSLLDFVGTYVERQMTEIAEQSLRSLQTNSVIWTSSATSAGIERVVDETLGRLLACAGAASEIVSLVKQHHKTHIEPHLDPQLASDSRRALQAFQRAVEHQVSSMLERSIQTLTLKIRDLMYLLQKKSDFLVSDDQASATITRAFRQVCSLVSALSPVVGRTLSPANRAAYWMEFTVKLKETLEQHILRYRYTRHGGLQLQYDINAVRAAVALSRGGTSLAEIMALSNLTIVEEGAVNEVSHSLSYLGVERVQAWAALRAA